MNDQSRFAGYFAIAAACITFNACGDSNFAGGGDSGGRGSNNANPTVPQGTQLTGLRWYWQCATDPGTPPQTSGTDLVIQDGGDHPFDSTSFAKDVPVTISGRVCPPIKYPRDIVFVIDVSGSMKDNDPLKAGSCGRLTAIQNIIAGITAQSSDTRFGLVTFDSDTRAKSSAMFADQTNLFTDIAGNKDAAKILCAEELNTSYGAGLSSAENILANSRPGAMKEIYFVSDGEPTDGTAGETLARRLRNQGVNVRGTLMPVQIATVMLGSSNGNILKNNIASVDRNGNPLFAQSADASQLSDVLSKLSANDIDDGVIKYRPTGTDAWTEVGLKTNMKGYDFTIPSFKITKATAPDGLDVQFEYKDLHNNVYSSGGNLKWTNKSK